MRIAHVISTPEGFGGAERVAVTLTEAARANGDQVVLLNPFATNPSTSLLSLASDALDYRGKAVRGVRHLPGLRRWLSHELSEFRPDLIHAHLFHASALTASLPWRNRRVLTHHHGEIFMRSRRRGRTQIDKAASRRFDRVVAVSKSVERFLAEGYGCPNHRLAVIPNGWDGRPVAPRSGPHPTLICTANFRPEKLHSVLIEALRMTQDDFPQIRLRLLGDGPLRSEVEAEASKLGLMDRVSFHGAVTDVWPHYSLADIAVLPSAYESLGIAALEAMAAGLPVVATRVGGLPELVIDGVTGILVPPNDPGALANAIRRLVAAPSEAWEMGAAGRARAACFSMKKMSDAYLTLYDEVIQGRPSSQ